MATDDEQRELDEQTLVVRNEIMQKIQRGEPFTKIEETAADAHGIRVPAFLRPGGGNDPDLDGARLDDAIEEQTGLHPADPEPERDDVRAAELASLSGEEWLEAFYNALAELWANVGWLPFEIGQLGAAVHAAVDPERVDQMFKQASDDIASIGEATKKLLEVAQQGLFNLQARRTPA